MEVKPPLCSTPECRPTLESRAAMARRGERVIAYTAHLWRCDRCSDPDTGAPPLEFLDAQLIAINDQALSEAWKDKYGEPIPASGRPGRRTDQPKTERVAVLLTQEELSQIDARRGHKSRSEFLRAVIAHSLKDHAA